MRILIVEPYYTGSHAAWADGIVRHSRHQVSLLTLPGRYWKWRMHGGSITLARRFAELSDAPDLIVATDMLNVPGFLALTRQKSHAIPVVLYFHENQLNYPWSPSDRDVVNNRDKHYAFVNYLSALAADRVLFNSEFHRRLFMDALPNFLKHFPDYNELSSLASIEDKSAVLPPGVDFNRLEGFRPPERGASAQEGGVPVVLWNHRWEYDKNPAEFFDALCALKKRGLRFRLVVLGEQFGTAPPEFEKAKRELESEILHFGYADSLKAYAQWLWRSDILPVTSHQEFFGISVLEAAYCECLLCLPNRLTYPELFPTQDFAGYFYQQGELCSTLEGMMLSLDQRDRTPFRQAALRYDWKRMIDRYDAFFEQSVP